METATLKRTRYVEDGTFGELWYKDKLICVTCEDEWNDNQTGISCIPAGEYICIPHSTLKYPDVWEVTNVPGRSAILIHNGNTENDTRGCILVGDLYGFVDGKEAVLHSKNTLAKLRGIFPTTFKLEIVNASQE